MNPGAGGTDLPDFESGPFTHEGTSLYETPSRGDANIKKGENLDPIRQALRKGLSLEAKRRRKLAVQSHS